MASQNMREKMKELLLQVDPEIRELVAMVYKLERSNLDHDKPHIKEKIREMVEDCARRSLTMEPVGENKR